MEVEFIKSTIDNKEYLVRSMDSYDDMLKAANMLANLNIKMTKLIEYVYNNRNQLNFINYKPHIERLKGNYNPNVLSESSVSSKYTSYSVNKGERIVFCLRGKDEKQSLISINTVSFVAIHELGHLMTKEIGHTKTFWNNMRFLLIHGIDQNIYIEQDFNNLPVPYCGMTIQSSPLVPCCNRVTEILSNGIDNLLS